MRISQRSRLFAGVSFLLMASALPSHAQEKEAQQEVNSSQLMEAFIGLRVGKDGSSFYRVMVDENEDPYFAVDSFLSHWLGLTPNCTPQRLYCTVSLPKEDKPRWFDGQNLLMSDSKATNEIGISNDSVILKDGVIWVDYKTMEQWLPMKLVWSLRSYQMSLNVLFETPEKIRKKRLKAIEREKDKKINRNNKDEANSIEVADGNRFYEARGEIRATAKSSGDVTSQLSFDVGADLFRGRLQAGGALSRDENDPLQYWQYERFNNQIGEYFALGQVLFEGGISDQTRVLENGYRIMKNYQNEGSGDFTFNADAPKESIVDVYKNGFYQDTIIASKVGKVVINNIQASAGDIITIKILTKEGVSSEKSFKISGSSKQYLEKYNWDYEFSGGSDEIGTVHSLDLKYGVASNVTGGINLKQESSDGGSEMSSYLSLAFRPHHLVSVQLQKAIGENSWSYSSDLNLSSHDFRLFGQNIETSSLASDLSAQPQNYHGIEHAWSAPRIQSQARVISSDDELRLKERLGIKVKSGWDIILEGEIIRNGQNDTVKKSWMIEQVYTLPSGLKIKAGYARAFEHNRVFGALRFVGTTEAPWSSRRSNNKYSITANVDSLGGDIEVSGGLAWYQGESWSGSFNVSKDSVSADVRWKFGLASKTGHRNEAWHSQSWDSFGQGTLKGCLEAPRSESAKPIVLDNVGVLISNHRVLTDSDGCFEATGLPVNQRLTVMADISSLPIDMMPRKKEWSVTLRPGTILEFNPTLIWAVGVDGFVDNEIFKEGMTLVFNHERLGKLDSVKVEQDGFFIAEKLAPGQYDVELIYPGGESMSKDFEVDPEKTWMSDIRI